MAKDYSVKMIEQQENKEQDLNELEKFAKAHIKVGERLPYRADDPFLVKKLEDARKTFEEAPLPEWLVKKMNEKE